MSHLLRVEYTPPGSSLPLPWVPCSGAQVLPSLGGPSQPASSAGHQVGQSETFPGRSKTNPREWVWRMQLGAGLFNNTEANPPSSSLGQRKPPQQGLWPHVRPWMPVLCHCVASLWCREANSRAGGLEPRRWGNSCQSGPGLHTTGRAGGEMSFPD